MDQAAVPAQNLPALLQHSPSCNRATVDSGAEPDVLSQAVSEFNLAEFLRRLDAGEFDGVLLYELDKLSDEELEELALVLTGQMRVKAAGGPV